MTLRELIQKATIINNQMTSADILVVNELWCEVDYDFEIVQDTDEKYYVKMTQK
jgi:hypothetical protein